MSGALKSALTLAVLAVLVLVAALWGWGALTEPFPEDEPVAICEDETITAGSEVRRDQVVVSVFNGSGRSGLAGATSAQLGESNTTRSTAPVSGSTSTTRCPNMSQTISVPSAVAIVPAHTPSTTISENAASPLPPSHEASDRGSRGSAGGRARRAPRAATDPKLLATPHGAGCGASRIRVESRGRRRRTRCRS